MHYFRFQRCNLLASENKTSGDLVLEQDVNHGKRSEFRSLEDLFTTILNIETLLQTSKLQLILTESECQP